MSHLDELPPAFRAPPKSCDAHFHVFGPADRYPHGGVNEKLRYAPPLAPLSDYLTFAQHLGIEPARGAAGEEMILRIAGEQLGRRL